MHAILYAAGRGSRLGPALPAPHKILIEFDGRSLLERHVSHLAALGVPSLSIVTGHARDAVTAALQDLRRRYPIEIQEFFNPDFLEGSVLSMRASLPALRETKDAVLLMDGDVLYGLELLKRLAHSVHRTALLVDREYSTEDDDPVLVPLRQGRPFDFVKRWQGTAEAVGESVGFFKVDAADVPTLIRETEQRSEDPGRGDSYDDVLRALVQAGRFGAEDITGMPWTEIDFPSDLNRARRVILPQI